MIGQNIKLSHPTLAAGRWAELPFPLQMGNIGSEISRAIKSKIRGNEERAFCATTRAIELFELSIDCNSDSPTRLKELCRGKEEFCDYVFGGNSFGTNPNAMIRYYNQFVTLVR